MAAAAPKKRLAALPEDATTVDELFAAAPIYLNRQWISRLTGVSRAEVDRLAATGEFGLPNTQSGSRPKWLKGKIKDWHRRWMEKRGR